MYQLLAFEITNRKLKLTNKFNIITTIKKGQGIGSST
jgi:hypothetical protein